MFSVIASQMAASAMLLVVGIYAAWKHIVREANLQGIVDLVLKILLPAMMFTCIYTGATNETICASLPMIGLAMVFYPMCAVLMRGFGRVLVPNDERCRIFQMTFLFGNTGFIGLPLLASVFPESGAVNLIMFMLVDQVVFWSYGARLADPSGKRRMRFRDFLNPNIVAAIVAFAFVLSGIRLPECITATLSLLGGAASPLGMLCMGIMCYFAHVGSVLKARELYVGIIAKMVVLPIIVGLLLLALPIGRDVAVSMILMIAMPATTLVPLAVESEGGDGSWASALVTATIVASTATVPFVAFALGI